MKGIYELNVHIHLFFPWDVNASCKQTCRDISGHALASSLCRKQEADRKCVLYGDSGVSCGVRGMAVSLGFDFSFILPAISRSPGLEQQNSTSIVGLCVFWLFWSFNFRHMYIKGGSVLLMMNEVKQFYFYIHYLKTRHDFKVFVFFKFNQCSLYKVSKNE